MEKKVNGIRIAIANGEVRVYLNQNANAYGRANAGAFYDVRKVLHAGQVFPSGKSFHFEPSADNPKWADYKKSYYFAPASEKALRRAYQVAFYKSERGKVDVDEKLLSAVTKAEAKPEPAKATSRKAEKPASKPDTAKATSRTSEKPNKPAKKNAPVLADDALTAALTAAITAAVPAIASAVASALNASK